MMEKVYLEKPLITCNFIHSILVNFIGYLSDNKIKLKKMPDTPDNKFIIVVKKAPDYRIIPGNVVYGGPSPDLEGVVINFCVDHTALPNYIEHDIVNGKVNASQPINQVTIGNVEREVLCGVTMSLDQAKKLCVWLKAVIDNIEELRNG